MSRLTTTLLVLVSLASVAVAAQDSAVYYECPPVERYTEPPRIVDRETLPGATLEKSALTGMLRNLVGVFSFYGVEATPEEISRTFLAENAKLFGLSASTEELGEPYVTGREDLGYQVTFPQEYRGVPVRGHVLSVNMNPRQEITFVTSNLVPISLSDVKPRVTAEEAEKLAVEALWGHPELAGKLGDSVCYHLTRPLQLQIDADTEVSAPRLRWDMGIQLIGSSAEPVWKSWNVKVDALDGTVWVWEYEPLSAQRMAKVFDPNPVVTSGQMPANNGGADTAFVTAQRTPFLTLHDLTDASSLGRWPNIAGGIIHGGRAR